LAPPEHRIYFTLLLKNGPTAESANRLYYGQDLVLVYKS